MLIKTRELVKRLKYDMNNFKIDGSKIFDTGSFQNLVAIETRDVVSAILEKKNIYEIFPSSIITDIDFMYIVDMKTDGFVDRLKKSITKLVNDDKTNLKFIDIIACSYADFKVPWDIETERCDFSLTKSREWITQLKEQPLYNDAEYINSLKIIEDILYGEKISIGDLAKIEDIIEPYTYVRWKYEDIMEGQKIFNRRKYYFSECVKQPDTIINCYYKYNGDYISMDIGLVDKNEKNKHVLRLYPYYTNNWYKILKSYKKYVTDKDLYFSKFNTLKYRPLLAKVDFILHMKKHKYISDKEIRKIENNFRKILGENYSDKNLVELRKIFYEQLNRESKIFADYFRERLKNNSFLNDISEETLNVDITEIDVSTLEELNESGVLCPFSKSIFIWEKLNKDNVEDYLKNISRRMLFDFDFFSRCVKDVCERNSLRLVDVVNTHFFHIKARYIYMVRMKGKILLKGDFGEDDFEWFINNNGVSINNNFMFAFDEKDLKKLQLYMLM
jgi:hypothetical protein